MDHQANFHDSITSLLLSACRPGQCIELYVAEALARFFIASSLRVVWGSTVAGRDPTGVIRDVNEPARRMTLEETTRLRAGLPPFTTERAYEDLVVGLYETDGPPWAIELADPEPLGRDRLLLVLEGEEARGLDPFRFFKTYRKGQRELYAVVKALHSSARFAEWNRDVERLTSDTQAPLAERLDQASRMVGELSREPTPEMMALIQRLAIWAMQQLFGTGWRVRRMDGRTEQLRAFCAQVRAAADQWQARACDAEGGFVGPLRCLADMLGAETEVPSLLAGEAFRARQGGDQALELLRTWTLIHELARGVWRHDLQDDEPLLRTWLEIASRSRPELARFLEGSFAKACKDAALLRNWMRLWFSHELDWGLLDEELMERELTSFPPWRWRADLAYVIRESLRFACFGDRPDYLVQPDTLAESLRTVVEYHAIGSAGVPSGFNVNWILQEIADVTRAEEYHFNAGHLQHVLETYIFGHFLCSIVVKDEGGAPGASFDGWTVAQLLASPGSEPDPDRTQELRQAFSVAAIFHDVGMILFPRDLSLRKSVYDRDEKLKEHLKKMSEVFGGAGVQVSKICVEDLEAGRYFDRAKDAQVASWMDDHRSAEPGRPDHALLGAWCLHRLCCRLGGDSLEVVRRALRAIILHQVMQHPIDARVDPAAAILALCDELFEWDPYLRAVPVHNAMTRSLHTMAVGMHPHPSRARRIEIRGLTVRATAEGNVVATLPRAAGQVSGWPAIEVELKHPEFLDAKVHQYWLTMAQNLGRIAPHRGWGPEVQVTSQIPPWLEDVGGSRRLLQRALDRSTHRCVGRWRTWLANPHRFSRSGGWALGKRGGWETVILGPIGKPFEDDVREYLQELEGLIGEALGASYRSIPPGPLDGGPTSEH